MNFELFTSVYAWLVRWAFTRFYREFAWTYDAVAALVSGGHWREWALAAVPYARGQTLELGCGTGNLQCALARDVPAHSLFNLAFGLDISRQMLAHTHRKAQRAGVEARLLRGDASLLPLRDASFDTIIATFPSEYIVAQATLAEVRRVLRPDGQLVVLLGAQLSGAGWYERVVDVAYRVTLQASQRAKQPPITPLDSPLHAALLKAGFVPRADWIAAPGGHVYIIVGELP